jgi:hypothetical protein
MHAAGPHRRGALEETGWDGEAVGAETAANDKPAPGPTPENRSKWPRVSELGADRALRGSVTGRTRHHKKQVCKAAWIAKVVFMCCLVKETSRIYDACVRPRSVLNRM